MWTLSPLGWLAAVVLSLALGLVVFFGIHPFLAVTERAPSASILVVEGWVPDYALVEGWKEFERGHYRRLLVTGVRGREGAGMDDNDTYAGWGAERMQKLVGQHKEIVAVPAFEAPRDRTYTSAVALGAWLARQHDPAKALNVVTMTAHARRSRLMFEKALGPHIDVGVIAITNRDYDPSRWWRYSEGVKEVLSEGAAYVYARLFFYP